MGSVIMAIRTPGLRDFIMKVRTSSSRRVAPASPGLSAELRRPAQVPADEGESWRSVVMDNGATEERLVAHANPLWHLAEIVRERPKE